jgi:DNA polymerase
VPCDVLFCGEAPGASEDAIGQPFVGRAGMLLDQIVERAVPAGVRCTFCNLVACFPREAKGRGDNEPEHNEIAACRPRLAEFIELAAPKLIVWVGVLAETYGPLATDHYAPGYRSTRIVHPAAILRMPLAQKQMATQKSVVVLRNAIEDTFTNRGNNAGIKTNNISTWRPRV